VTATTPVTPVVAAAAPGPPPRQTASGGQTRLAILVLPALLFFLAFAFIPMIGVLLLSFTDWDGISPINFAGLTSWVQVFSDPGTYTPCG
jgi:raffinose/stachyose/melibiose transport system permease protein